MVHGTGFPNGGGRIWQPFEDVLERTASSPAPPLVVVLGRHAPHKGGRRYVLFQSSVRAQSADLDIMNGDTDAGVKLFLCMTEGGAERQAARPELTLGDTQTCPRSASTGMSIQQASDVDEEKIRQTHKKMWNYVTHSVINIVDHMLEQK